MNTLQKIETVLAANGLTFEVFKTYEKASPATRAKIHKAAWQLYYQENLSISKMLREMPKNHRIDRSKFRRMINGFDATVKTRHYTAEENELVRTVATGATYSEVAAKIGRTPEAVKNQARRLGVNYKKSRPEYFEELRLGNLKYWPRQRNADQEHPF